MINTKHDETITKVIKAVFPAGTQIGKVTRATPPENRYLIIHGRTGPRWIVPSKKAIGHDFLSEWRPYKGISNCIWTVVLIAYKMGILKYFPRMKLIGITPPGDLIWKLGSWTSEKGLFPVMFIGSKRPLEKAIVGLVAANSKKANLILKVALNTKGQEKIRNETKIMDSLARDIPDVAPALVFSCSKGGFSGQECISGPLTKSRLSSGHVALLKKLKRNGKYFTPILFAENLLKKTNKLDPAIRETLNAALKKVSSKDTLPLVWAHGDFAPWNIKAPGTGKLVALDWELGTPEGLPLYDIVYFYVSLAYLFGNQFPLPEEIAPEVQDYLAYMDIPMHLVKELTLLCLVNDYIASSTWGLKSRLGFLLEKIKEMAG